ncbi:hypothetical protein FB567DRAFT_549348 [Paraphoma chrysanthemicola]|uniref:RING-type domain-containing protein n=1 Tax=Paraphoma chrysanthemicola TaxID=798071 RepID=A0A8K0R5C8_9PLEO|nr:hypothetical protein FB567DRAFT_549348 [Paraphoma chrysanthemicola]
MVTKDQFMDSLDALTCSLCLEPYTSDHVPIQLPCNHIFGDYCIANVAESESPNNNRCPLCRTVLFEQEDFNENGDPISDEEEREFDGFSDEDDLDEEQLMARDGELLVDADETVAALAMDDETDDEMDFDLSMPEGLETMDGEETVASLAMPEEQQVAAVEQNNARASEEQVSVRQQESISSFNMARMGLAYYVRGLQADRATRKEELGRVRNFLLRSSLTREQRSSLFIEHVNLQDQLIAEGAVAPYAVSRPQTEPRQATTVAAPRYDQMDEEDHVATQPQIEPMVPANGEAGNNAGTGSNISSDNDVNPVLDLDDEGDADVSSDDELSSVSEPTDEGGEPMPASSTEDEIDSGSDADSGDSGDSIPNVAENDTIQEKDVDVEMQDVDESAEAIDSDSEYEPSSDGDVDTDDSGDERGPARLRAKSRHGQVCDKRIGVGRRA